MSNTLDFVTGDWVVRVTELRLENLTSGNVTALEPRVASLLISLVSRQGGLVSKDTLLEEVWQGSVVSDDSIAQAVSRLRKLLGDDPKAPQYIETVWKKGYRWLPPVSNESFSRVTTPLMIADKNKPMAWIAGSLVVGLFVIIALVFLTPEKSHKPLVFEIKPLTSSAGFEDRGALSPDGTNVVYQYRQDNQTSPHIIMQDTQGSASRQLTVEQKNFSPVFSSDGNRVAFIRYLDEGGCQVVIKGLVSNQQTIAGDCLGSEYADLDWSNSNQQFALGLRPNPTQPNAIYLLKDGKSTQVSFPPISAWGDFNPTFSGDGKTVVFTRAYTEMQHDLFITSTDQSMPERRLTHNRSAIMGSTWTPDNRHLIYATRLKGRYQLQQLNIASGQSQPINLAAFEVLAPNISANGDLVATIRDFDTDLYRVNLTTKASKPLFDSTHWDLSPMISNDNQHFVFTSNRTGHFQLWLGDLGSGKTRPLTTFDGNYVVSPRFSADGTRVVFEVHQGDNSQIYTYSLASGLLLKLTSHPSNNVFASISSDGSNVYFGSNRGGDWQIWQKPMDGGTALQVTDSGGFVALPSLDGRWLYFSKRNEPGLWKKDLSNGTVSQVTKKLQADDAGAFALSQKGVVYLDRSQGQYGTIDHISHQSSSPQTIYTLLSPIPRFDAVLSVDANLDTLYLVRNSQIMSDLILVKGAFAKD